jgi:hypothetical protein
LSYRLLSIIKDLLVELWFYRLAHCPDYRQQAIRQLDVLLKNGAKSIGWDFSANIERAKEQGFERAEINQPFLENCLVILAFATNCGALGIR